MSFINNMRNTEKYLSSEEAGYLYCMYTVLRKGTNQKYSVLGVNRYFILAVSCLLFIA